MVCAQSTAFFPGERAFSDAVRHHTILISVVALLTRRLAFPSAEMANADGLVAVGGDLSPDRLLLAYRSGIFPWPVFEDDLMTWFSPNPRAILEFYNLRVSRSLRKVLKREIFEVRFDSDFAGVIDGCQAPAPGRQGTWITRQLRAAYVELHRLGYAHSVESWFEGALVGGLYGVALGGFFSGESMFSRASDASKVALVHLVQHLRNRGFQLLDVQQSTHHLMNFGATELERPAYLRRLKEALEAPCTFSDEART
ncbi:MAG: leucyl/phenylalanyl-tRNA--protein transferase [Deltaproteobacteria bacterium]|nr:leucyl/phenylalanyl-tRNA--protein transferase [Deltaproteobacteria bacterium]